MLTRSHKGDPHNANVKALIVAVPIYFTPSMISSSDFVKIMVDACNPENYIKVKIVFYIPLRLNFMALYK